MKNNFLKKVILGFLIGIAVIVPGISGSTIMILFKLYKKILNAISNIFKDFKKSIVFLFPLIIGGVIGILGGFLAVKKLIDIIPFSISALFAGLMLGAVPGLFDEIKGVKPNKRNILGTIIAFLIPIGISSISIFVFNPERNVLNLTVSTTFIFIGLGIVVALTQFIPGASASATLMGFGYYVPLMSSLSLGYIKENPIVIVIYLLLIIGVLIGAVLSAKALDALTNKFKESMYFIFIGLSLGSIVCIFYNIDIINVYKSWSNGVKVLDLVLGLGLFVIGLISSFILVLYMRKKNKNQSKKASLSVSDLCNTYATSTFEDFEFIGEVELEDNNKQMDGE